MQRGGWLNLQPKFPHLEAFNGDGEVFWLLTHNFSFLVFIFWVYFPVGNASYRDGEIGRAHV